jgi:hypothetical protein
MPMTAWTSDELTKIGKAEELDLASLRADGTLRKPVTMWVVRVGDDLYVRAYKGRSGAWFRGTLTRHAGHIRAGGVDKDVAFVEEADPGINSQIDAVYRTKYRRYDAQYVDPMVTPGARAATLKLVPRSTNT